MRTMIAALIGVAGCLGMVALGPAFAREDAISLKDLPELGDKYKVDPYIQTAIKLQDLGKEKACATLLALGKDRDQGDKVIVLCRMLFKKKADGMFRRPGLGGAIFFGKTDYKDWPLEPIEMVDDIPLFIVRAYVLRGEAEPADDYVKYCMDNCDWNDVQFKEKTAKEKQEALKKLLASPKWKAKLDDQEKEFLSSQIKVAHAEEPPEGVQLFPKSAEYHLSFTDETKADSAFQIIPCVKLKDGVKASGVMVKRPYRGPEDEIKYKQVLEYGLSAVAGDETALNTIQRSVFLPVDDSIPEYVLLIRKLKGTGRRPAEGWRVLVIPQKDVLKNQILAVPKLADLPLLTDQAELLKQIRSIPVLRREVVRAGE